jgi:hypothetical protein
MASTFSPLLKIELIGIGDQDNTWGSTNNSNLGTLIEEAIAGTATINVTSGNVTLTNLDGAADQARCSVLRVIGTPGVSRNIIAPAHSKIFVVANGSDAAVVLKTSTSTGLTIPTNEIYLAYYDTTLNDFEYVGKAASATNIANTLVLRDSIGSFGANIIAANEFVGDITGTSTTQAFGNNTTSIATTAFVQAALQALYPIGCIYTSTVATNPNSIFGFGTWVAFGAGRVLVGSGGSLSGTGGSYDAIVPSHSHTASSSSSTAISDPGHQHSYYSLYGGGNPSKRNTDYDGNSNAQTGVSVTGISASTSTSTTVNATGVSVTNANVQPYITVYMWNRTA